MGTISAAGKAGAGWCVRFFAVVLLLSLTAAPAQAWDVYEDLRLGFVLEIPPGFEASGEADGDESRFTAADGAQALTISGGTVLPGSFNDIWIGTRASYRDQGWVLRYDPRPPNWTSFTATRSERALFAKMIPLCGGTKSYAMLVLEYPRAEAAALAPVIDRLAASLKPAGTGLGC